MAYNGIMTKAQQRMLFVLLGAVLYLLYAQFSRVLNLKPFSPPTRVISPTISSASASATMKVTRVIDGDTIELANGKKVRYIGIDTPETKHPTKGVQCFGVEAYRKNKELIEGKEVQLEKDVSETDKYGRLLRYVYIASSSAQPRIFVNEYLVKEGYATAATFPPDVKYAELFRKDQQQAREQQKGLWLACKL